MLGLLAFAAAVRAEEPFSFAATPGRLPKTVVPRHCAITLQPDAGNLSTTGAVTIDLEVSEPARVLTFNALELEFTAAEVDGVKSPLPRLDAEAQTATIELASPLAPGRHTLHLVLCTFERLEVLARETPGRMAFDQWWLQRLRGPFVRLGWEARDGERSNDRVLRARLIQALGQLGDREIVAEAKQRFSRFLREPDSLAADLRTPVCRIAGWFADVATSEKLHALARTATSTEEQQRYYRAFEGVRDPVLAQRTLELALTEERPLAQWFHIVPNVAKRHPVLAWDFAQSQADGLLAKLPAGGAFLTRNTYFPAIAENFQAAGRADELMADVWIAARKSP